MATLLVAMLMVSIFAVMCEAEEIDTEAEIDILPIGKTFTYMTDDFQINVRLPLNLVLSTSDIKEDNKLDVYFMPFSSLSGLFRVDVEAGIKVRIPLVALLFFVDIDTMILGEDRPDIFRFEWPILGIPLQAMSLESGDIGVYSIAIPTKVGEGNLENLSVGEWNHIASYDLYVVMAPKIIVMGMETEDITIGSVMEFERIETEIEELNAVEIESEIVNYYRELYENLQKRYNSLLLNFKRLQEDLDEANLETSSTRSELDLIELELEEKQLEYNSLLLNYTRLQKNLDKANIELSVNRYELDLVELELEEKRSELNKAYDKITIFQVTALVAFVAGLSLMHIISKRGKVTPQAA